MRRYRCEQQAGPAAPRGHPPGAIGDSAINAYLARGTLDDTLVLDAVQLNLIKIGEAVAALPDSVRAQEPDIPWKQIVGMRNELTHAYFRVSPAIIRNTVERSIDPLRDAVQRILGSTA